MCCRPTLRCEAVGYAVLCSLPGPIQFAARSARWLTHHPVLTQAKNFHGTYQDPTLYVQTPLQVAAEREAARYYFQQVCTDLCMHILSSKFTFCYSILKLHGLITAYCKLHDAGWATI